MTRPLVHVCIASGQNIPNLIPALQLGAQNVFILVTPQMREGAQNLRRALEAHGIATTRLPFNDQTPAAIAKAAESVAMKLGEQPLVFNATGGHKLLTLALAEKMEVADELHLLYVETRHDRLDWLKPRAEMEPMLDVLTLEDILVVQGYSLKSRGSRDVRWSEDVKLRASLTRQMGDKAESLAGVFGVLNRLADLALANEPDGPFRPAQEFEFVPGGDDARVLRDAHTLGLLDWERRRQVVFQSKDSARYFRGGWLEEYAWLKLRGLRPTDCDVNVRVESVLGRTPNELDALVSHRNRLLVVECKTSRFGRDPARDADYIYKLAQLSRSLGGIMGGSLLLSARPITPETRQRARENGVDVLAAPEVKNLVKYFRDWMGR